MACQGFDNLRETFPETLSGTGNFPEAIGVILKEAQSILSVSFMVLE